MRRVGARGDTPHARPPRWFSACNRSPPAGALIALEPVASVRRVALRPLALRPVAPSVVFYSALSHAGPPCCSPARCTPPCRTPSALSHSDSSHERARLRRVQHVRLRPVALSDVLNSAPSHSASVHSAALLLGDQSHSNLRAACDSVECVRSAPPRKKLRVLDSILPPLAPKSYALTTRL